MSGPFACADEAREIADVNVVPLADVSLVLLIILLVLSPMMRQTMLHVRAAAESSKPQPAPPHQPAPPELVLVVGLNPDGLVVGFRRFTAPSEFIGYIQQELARRTDKKVYLSPHPDVPVGLVVHTLETLKTCGAESVALVQTQQDPKPNTDAQIRAAAPAL